MMNITVDDNFKEGLISKEKLQLSQEQLAYLIVELVVESYFQEKYAHKKNGNGSTKRVTFKK